MERAGTDEPREVFCVCVRGEGGAEDEVRSTDAKTCPEKCGWGSGV